MRETRIEHGSAHGEERPLTRQHQRSMAAFWATLALLASACSSTIDRPLTTDASGSPSSTGSPTASTLSVVVLETQSWRHQGDAHGRVVVVAPPNLRPVEVTLRERSSGQAESFALADTGPNQCYMKDLDPSAKLYITKGSVVIDQGALTEENRGPKIDQRYSIEVVLEDEDGDRQVATGTPGGLCSVVTE